MDYYSQRYFKGNSSDFVLHFYIMLKTGSKVKIKEAETEVSLLSVPSFSSKIMDAKFPIMPLNVLDGVIFSDLKKSSAELQKTLFNVFTG